MDTFTIVLNVNFRGNVDFVSIQDHVIIPGALDGPVGHVRVQAQPAAGGLRVIGAHPDELCINLSICICKPFPHFGHPFG